MAFTLDTSKLRLDAYREAAIDGAAAGLDAEAARVTAEMQATTAHGDITGATRASYTAYRVGRGQDGSAEAQASAQAAEQLNPGHSARGSVAVPTALAFVLSSGTDYQEELETENAGRKAVLAPTLGGNVPLLMESAAAGARRAR